MRENPVGWFEIYVQDMSRAKKFYESLLEVSLERLEAPDFEMFTFPMKQEGKGISGALIKAEGIPSGGNSVLVYFSCEDCAIEAARIERSGGKLHRDKMSIGQYGFIALGIDTEGNMFGLHSLK